MMASYMSDQCKKDYIKMIEKFNPAEGEELKTMKKEKVDGFLSSVRRSLSRSYLGFVDGLEILSKPTGFDWKDVGKIKGKIIVTSGEFDTLVPSGHQRYLAKTIPGNKFIEYKGETHFHVIVHIEELLSELFSE